MKYFFIVIFTLLVLLMILMLLRIFKGPSVYDRLNGIFVISIDIIAALMIVGFIDGRTDMYVDIAISYGLLGFISTIFVAKYLSRKAKRK